jgi:hypothetical protein
MTKSLPRHVSVPIRREGRRLLDELGRARRPAVTFSLAGGARCAISLTRS